MNNKILFLDTETTGTEEEDRLCQVAYEYDGKVVNELFKPPLKIKIEAMAITHITEKMVAEKPVFIGSPQFDELKRLADEGYILVAHNAKYDLKMLKKEGIEFKQHICTLKVARFLDTNGVIASYGLQYIRYLIGLDIEAVAHDALGDILVLKALYNRLVQKMSFPEEQVEFYEDGVIGEMVKISTKPSMIKYFTFGKHKGKKIEDVFKSPDRDYLNWLYREKKANEPDDEDWIYTLEYYLHGKRD